MNKFKVFAVALLCCAASYARANTILTDSGSGSPAAFASPGNVGFDFTVGSAPLLITALGLWDENQDGFASEHVVGLWDNSGTLLAKAVMAIGTIDPLDGEFRYATLIPVIPGPIILSPGSTYVLGAAFLASDPDHFRESLGANQPTVDPAVTLGDSRDSVGGFSFPNDTSFGPGAFVGPNARFSVPELGPGVFLIALVFGGLFLVHRLIGMA